MLKLAFYGLMVKLVEKFKVYLQVENQRTQILCTDKLTEH